MEWLIWALVPVVLWLAALAGNGRFGDMPGPVRDAAAPVLPDGPLSAGDVRGIRFGLAWRGYSMDQVDAVMDRLARQLEARGSVPEPDASAPPSARGDRAASGPGTATWATSEPPHGK